MPSLEDTIREKAKKSNNTHFMIVDGICDLLCQKVKKLESSHFDAFDLKWNLLIRSDEKKDYLSSYLYLKDKQCTGSNREVECTFKLSVVSQTSGENICKPATMPFKEGTQSSWGWTEFASHEVLKKSCIVSDKAVFSAEITHVKPNFTVTPVCKTTTGTADRVKVMEVPRKNSRFTWKITRFSSFTDKSHSSYEFTVGQRRWKLLMYPKGDKNGDGHLSLYLSATDYVPNSPKAPTMAVYKLRVLDQLKHNHYETNNDYVFSNDMEDPLANSYGRSKYLPLEELNKPSRGLLLNDEIYLGVEFLFVSTTEIL